MSAYVFLFYFNLERWKVFWVFSKGPLLMVLKQINNVRLQTEYIWWRWCICNLITLSLFQAPNFWQSNLFHFVFNSCFEFGNGGWKVYLWFFVESDLFYVSLIRDYKHNFWFVYITLDTVYFVENTYKSEFISLHHTLTIQTQTYWYIKYIFMKMYLNLPRWANYKR